MNTKQCNLKPGFMKGFKRVINSPIFGRNNFKLKWKMFLFSLEHRNLVKYHLVNMVDHGSWDKYDVLILRRFGECADKKRKRLFKGIGFDWPLVCTIMTHVVDTHIQLWNIIFYIIIWLIFSFDFMSSLRLNVYIVWTSCTTISRLITLLLVLKKRQPLAWD